MKKRISKKYITTMLVMLMLSNIITDIVIYHNLNQIDSLQTKLEANRKEVGAIVRTVGDDIANVVKMVKELKIEFVKQHKKHREIDEGAAVNG